jgi:hypothetical protein
MLAEKDGPNLSINELHPAAGDDLENGSTSTDGASSIFRAKDTKDNFRIRTRGYLLGVPGVLQDAKNAAKNAY